VTGTWKGRGEVAGEIQRGFGRAFMAFLWANAGLVALAGAWRGTLPLELSLPAGLALAGIPTLLWTRTATRGSAPVIGSTALACLVALLVAAFRHDRGMSLQIDLHMYFFACLAICVGWLNWRAILAYGFWSPRTTFSSGCSTRAPSFRTATRSGGSPSMPASWPWRGLSSSGSSGT
jgi:hypothetical protein